MRWIVSSVTQPSLGVAAVDEVEGAAVQAFVTFSLQLTESSFVPVFTQVVEWAKARAKAGVESIKDLCAATRTSLEAQWHWSSTVVQAWRAKQAAYEQLVATARSGRRGPRPFAST